MRRWAMYGLAIMFYVAVLAIVTSGCGKRTAVATVGNQQIGRHILAVANAVTVEHLKYLAYAGVVLMVFGVLFAIAKRWWPSFASFIGGGAMEFIYASLSEFTYITLIASLILLSAFVVLIVYFVRNKDALRELVLAIEKNPKVKDDIGDGNLSRRARVKRVVTPIKNDLQKERAI